MTRDYMWFLVATAVCMGFIAYVIWVPMPLERKVLLIPVYCLLIYSAYLHRNGFV